MKKALTLVALLGSNVEKDVNMIECNSGNYFFRVVSFNQSQVMEVWGQRNLIDRFSLNYLDDEIFGSRSDYLKDYTNICKVNENAIELNGCLVDNNLFIKSVEPRNQELFLKIYDLDSPPFMEPNSFSLDIPEKDLIRYDAQLLNSYKRCLE